MKWQNATQRTKISNSNLGKNTQKHASGTVCISYSYILSRRTANATFSDAQQPNGIGNSQRSKQSREASKHSLQRNIKKPFPPYQLLRTDKHGKGFALPQTYFSPLPAKRPMHSNRPPLTTSYDEIPS